MTIKYLSFYFCKSVHYVTFVHQFKYSVMSQFCVIFSNSYGHVAMVVDAPSKERAICEAVLHPSREKSAFDRVQANSILVNAPQSEALKALHTISRALEETIRRNAQLDVPGLLEVCRRQLNKQ